jgi:hypothetical protein
MDQINFPLNIAETMAKNESLLKYLSHFLTLTKTWDLPKAPSNYAFNQHFVSPEFLSQIREFVDVSADANKFFVETLENRSNYIDIKKKVDAEPSSTFQEIQSIVMESLAKQLKKILHTDDASKSPEIRCHLSGAFVYPPGSFVNWHTNNNVPGHRLYMAHADENGKSFFRYQDPDTGEIVTDFDKPGWNFRHFLVDPRKPFWHCVYSDTTRFSLGYNIKLSELKKMA